jgi:hypothetical protein
MIENIVLDKILWKFYDPFNFFVEKAHHSLANAIVARLENPLRADKYIYIYYIMSYIYRVAAEAQRALSLCASYTFIIIYISRLIRARVIINIKSTEGFVRNFPKIQNYIVRLRGRVREKDRRRLHTHTHDT